MNATATDVGSFTATEKFEVIAGDLLARLRARKRDVPDALGTDIEHCAKHLADAIAAHQFEVEKPLSDQARETLWHAAARVKELEEQLSNSYNLSALQERTYARREGELDAKLAAAVYEGNVQAENRFKRIAKTCAGKPEDPVAFVERTCELYGMPPRGRGLAMPAGDSPN